jgi:hypothetical protein
MPPVAADILRHTEHNPEARGQLRREMRFAMPGEHAAREHQKK